MNHTSSSSHAVAGHPAVFDVIEGGETLGSMSAREARILVGAANFHAFCAPGRTLELLLYRGDEDLTPRTSDDRTFDGLSRVFRHRAGRLVIASRLPAADPVVRDSEGARLIALPTRHVLITPDAVLEVPPRRWQPTDPVRRALRAVRTRWPLVYDQARDLELLRFRRALRTPAGRRDYEAEFAPGGPHEDARIVPAPPVREGAAKAVLIGMHWFELGGAERWALETVRIVREAGLLPIVVSNVDSQHPFICRPELEGAMVIPMSEPTHVTQDPGAEPFLRSLLAEYDLRGVIVHHNQWLYDRLPWIRLSRPGVPVLDSTHIVEYRGGGYPMSSVRADRSIDIHHVISPSLGRWMVDTQRVDPAKVVMAPLGGLTVDRSNVQYSPRRVEGELTVAFVGRMSRQKSPEVFIAMAAALRARGERVRFIMHGDGELDDWVDDLLAGLGHDAPVVRRTSSDPVSRTFEEADLLAVTSHNEGLTLTTLEAVAHGVPVISTDVGAQSDVIPREALFSTNPVRGAREAADLVAALRADESARRNLWETEKTMVRELLDGVSATEWLRGVVAEW